MSKRARGEESKRMSPVLEHKGLRAKICSFLSIVDLQENTKVVSHAFRTTCNSPLVIYPILQQTLFSLIAVRLNQKNIFREGGPNCVFCDAVVSCARRSEFCYICVAFTRINEALSNPCAPHRSTKWVMRSILWIVQQRLVFPFGEQDLVDPCRLEQKTRESMLILLRMHKWWNPIEHDRLAKQFE